MNTAKIPNADGGGPSQLVQTMHRAIQLVSSLPTELQDALSVTVNAAPSHLTVQVAGDSLSDDAARGLVRTLAALLGTAEPEDRRIGNAVHFSAYGPTANVFVAMSPRYVADWLDRQQVTA